MPEELLTRLAALHHTEGAQPSRDTVRGDVLRGRRALRRRHVRRAAASTALAAAAVVAGLTAVSDHSNPAFAVETEPNGDVVVTVHQLDDSTALEESLRAHGVAADVRNVADLSGPNLRPDELPAGPPVDRTACTKANIPSLKIEPGQATITIPAATVATGQRLFIFTAEPEPSAGRLMVAYGSPISGCAATDVPGSLISWG